MGLGELQTSGRGTKMGNHRKPRLWSLQIHSTRGSVSKGLAAPTRDSTVKTQGESLTSPLPWCHHVFLNENNMFITVHMRYAPQTGKARTERSSLWDITMIPPFFSGSPSFRSSSFACLPCSLSERAVSLEIRRTSTICGSVPRKAHVTNLPRHLMVGPPWLFPQKP